jgi:hypothetical protein
MPARSGGPVLAGFHCSYDRGQTLASKPATASGYRSKLTDGPAAAPSAPPSTSGPKRPCPNQALTTSFDGNQRLAPRSRASFRGAAMFSPQQTGCGQWPSYAPECAFCSASLVVKLRAGSSVCGATSRAGLRPPGSGRVNQRRRLAPGRAEGPTSSGPASPLIRDCSCSSFQASRS